MKNCIQNLLILFLIIVLLFSISKYYFNKQMKKKINNFIKYQEYTPTDIKETIITYPINNNVINEEENNDINYVPDENITIIEENKNENNNDSFNYSKELSNDFNAFDPNEIFPSV